MVHRAYSSAVEHVHGMDEVGVRLPVGPPEQNSKVFLKQKCGTREARPKDSRRIPPTNLEFLARLRALIFRQEAGSKSEAILT